MHPPSLLSDRYVPFVSRMHREEAENEQQSRRLRQKRMQAVLSLKANIAATKVSSGHFFEGEHEMPRPKAIV